MESHGAGAGAGQEQLPPEQQVQLILKPCHIQDKAQGQQDPSNPLPGSTESALPSCPTQLEGAGAFPSSTLTPGPSAAEGFTSSQDSSFPHRKTKGTSGYCLGVEGGKGRKVGVLTLRWMWGEEERDNSQLEKPSKAWRNPWRHPHGHVEVGKALGNVQSQLQEPLEPD